MKVLKLFKTTSWKTVLNHIFVSVVLIGYFTSVSMHQLLWKIREAMSEA